MSPMDLRVFRVSRRRLLVAVIVFAVYVLAAKAGSAFYAGGRAAPAIVFPAAGVSIAALFLEGYGLWVIITAASLFNSFLNATPVLTALGIASGSTLQALLGTYLLRRFKFDPRLWRFRDVAVMVGVAVGATIISPTTAALMSWLTGLRGAVSPVQQWISWWLGGVLGVMLITPFLISWVTHPKLRLTRRSVLEGGIAFLALAGMSWLIYWTPTNSWGGVPLIYALLGPLFWISLRFGNRETITGLLAMSVISLTGTVFGWHGDPAATLGARLFQVQLLNIILSCIFFIVSAISEERHMAEATSKSYVNQLEEAFEKLKSADQAKTEFIAILAHELRNPLAPALSSLEFLELQEFSTPEKEEAAMQAKRNIKNMSHLLDDLLDVSRISQGKIKLQKAPVKLSALAARVVQNVQLLVDSRRHKLAVDVPDDLPEVLADSLRLEQVLTNLLTNAARYTEPDGKIWLTAWEEKGKMVIKVRDTGIGITPETLPDIFEMFNQARRGASRTSEGLGIGLGLVKKLVELHGGTVVAYSEGVGKGSEFTVRLPLAAAASAENPGAPVSAAPEKKMAHRAVKASKKRILVVDDNEAAANALVKLFNRLGHEARAAYRAQAGIDDALDFRPHIILLDIGMPEMDGYEVARKLRGYQEFEKTIIVAVSGYGQEEDRQRSREAGFDQHLVKPVDLDTWRGLLEKA